MKTIFKWKPAKQSTFEYLPPEGRTTELPKQKPYFLFAHSMNEFGGDQLLRSGGEDAGNNHEVIDITQRATLSLVLNDKDGEIP